MCTGQVYVPYADPDVFLTCLKCICDYTRLGHGSAWRLHPQVKLLQPRAGGSQERVAGGWTEGISGSGGRGRAGLGLAWETKAIC